MMIVGEEGRSGSVGRRMGCRGHKAGIGVC